MESSRKVPQTNRLSLGVLDMDVIFSTFCCEAVTRVGVFGAPWPNGIRVDIHDPLGADDPVPT